MLAFVSEVGGQRGVFQAPTMFAVGSRAPSVCNDMQEVFSSLGQIKEIRIIKDRLTGLSAGYGFVRYLHPPVAELARQVLNGAILCGLVCCLSHACPMALGHEAAPFKL